MTLFGFDAEFLRGFTAAGGSATFHYEDGSTFEYDSEIDFPENPTQLILIDKNGDLY